MVPRVLGRWLQVGLSAGLIALVAAGRGDPPPSERVVERRLLALAARSGLGSTVCAACATTHFDASSYV